MRQLEREGGILIATPYREGPVLAIARSAPRREQLDRSYTSLHTGTWASRAGAIPLSALRSRIQWQRLRRRFTGIPDDRVVTKARGAEVGVHPDLATPAAALLGYLAVIVVASLIISPLDEKGSSFALLLLAAMWLPSIKLPPDASRSTTVETSR